MKVMFLFILLFMLINVEASEKVKVLVVKGNVTKLLPGASEALKVKRGDLIPEDTSIVTRKKSFVRLKFADKSSMNIGPKSKVVISLLPPKKANVVNLLTGMIKAEVNKRAKKKTKNKMVVKTGSAVLGVRGTKFQSTFNPQNKTTSLVTIEGKVAMAKTTPKVAGNVSPEKLDKALSNTDTNSVVEVPAGRYSGVVAKVKKPTVPVKINPEQYNAMAKNFGSDKKAQEVLKTLKSDPKPEGFVNKPKGLYAPRAGGYVDFQTGLYVPPAAGSKLDEKFGTFEARDVGEVNKVTGDYIPPRGVKIDPKRGFVVDIKEGDKLAANVAQAKAKKLNKEVAKVVNIQEAEKQEPFWLTKYLPRDHKISLSIIPYQESLSVSRSNLTSHTTVDNDDFKSDANWMIFSWIQKWNDKWSTELKTGGGEINFDSNGHEDVSGPDSHDNEREYFSLGVMYKLTQNSVLQLELVDRTEDFIIIRDFPAGTQTEIEYRTQSTNYNELSYLYSFLEYEKWAFSTKISAYFFTKREIPTDYGEELESNMSGGKLNLFADYKFSQTINLLSGLWYQRIDAEAGDYKYKRKSGGLNLSVVWDI